jgi:anthranilate synthase/aminodeoxychorismate synthase-like glutamine amidotransferase
MRVFLVDNYDSFTFNLYQALAELGASTRVERNDAVSVEEIRDWKPSHVVLSPGPGHPKHRRDFGVCSEVIASMACDTPTLGVCLGHQGIVHHLGGRIVNAPEIVHGKLCRIRHNGNGLFAGLDRELEVMRYHSLVAEADSLPDCLEITATTADQLVMAVRHHAWPLVGLQFHPESFATPCGNSLLRNFLAMGEQP